MRVGLSHFGHEFTCSDDPALIVETNEKAGFANVTMGQGSMQAVDKRGVQFNRQPLNPYDECQLCVPGS